MAVDKDVARRLTKDQVFCFRGADKLHIGVDVSDPDSLCGKALPKICMDGSAHGNSVFTFKGFDVKPGQWCVECELKWRGLSRYDVDDVYEHVEGSDPSGEPGS